MSETSKMISAANKKDYMTFKGLVESLVEEKFKGVLQEKIEKVNIWEQDKLEVDPDTGASELEVGNADIEDEDDDGIVDDDEDDDEY